MSLLPEINQASAEINKFVAQANIHQTIAPVNPASFTDPADTALLASRDPVIREVSVGMTGDAYSDYSVSGTPPLSLTNSLGKPLKAWSVDVLPYQEGTGDPSPSNVRPIHGTDKLTITTAGKNLLDPAKRQNLSNNIYWYYNTSGLLLMAGVTYTFSLSSATAQNSIEKIGGPQLAVNYGKTSLTYTPSTDIYVWINAYFSGNFPPPSGGTSEVQCQLELGSTTTAYEAYQGTQYTITLPSTVYTATIGSSGGESRSKMVDMGDLTYALSSSGGSYNSFVTNSVAIKAPSSGADVIHAICSGLKSLSYGMSWTPNSIAPHTSTSNLMRVILPTTVTTAQECKEYVSGMKLVYERETPTAFAVPSVTIPTPTGTATTWATAEDGTVDSMSVTYIGKA